MVIRLVAWGWARVGSAATSIHKAGRFPNLVGTVSLREVIESLSSEMGMRVSGLKKISFGNCPLEACLLWPLLLGGFCWGMVDREAPLCSLGAASVIGKTRGFVMMETLHSCSVVNRDKHIPKSIHGLKCYFIEQIFECPLF